MSIGEMKRYLRNYYHGKYRGKSIDEMSDNQIIAIYFNLVERNRKAKTVVKSTVNQKEVINKPRFVYTDDKRFVIDRENDELLSIDEFKSMYR